MKLSCTDFTNSTLNDASFSREVDLNEEINLHYVKFIDTKLQRTDFIRADLGEANFEGADLINADMRGTNLGGANFNRANLEKTNFWGANLHKANLIGSINLTVDQLVNVHTLYNAQVDSTYKNYLMSNYPQLLEEPEKKFEFKIE